MEELTSNRADFTHRKPFTVSLPSTVSLIHPAQRLTLVMLGLSQIESICFKAERWISSAVTALWYWGVFILFWATGCNVLQCIPADILFPRNVGHCSQILSSHLLQYKLLSIKQPMVQVVIQYESRRWDILSACSAIYVRDDSEYSRFKGLSFIVISTKMMDFVFLRASNRTANTHEGHNTLNAV